MVALRVVSYNVQALRNDVNALVRVVRSLRPHVVVVQEAPEYWRWRSRNAELARRCGLLVAAGGGDGAEGSLIMASLAVRVHQARSVRLKRLPFHSRRGAAVAVCSLGGARFQAVGTHLSTDEAERGPQFRGLLENLGTSGPPIVLAADMNERHDGEAWRAAVACFTDVGVADPTFTYSCRSPMWRIDGIFTSPSITAREYRVIDSPDVRRASDHFPIYAELELPGGP